jgi:hypothetical protein
MILCMYVYIVEHIIDILKWLLHVIHNIVIVILHAYIRPEFTLYLQTLTEEAKWKQLRDGRRHFGRHLVQKFRLWMIHTDCLAYLRRQMQQAEVFLLLRTGIEYSTLDQCHNLSIADLLRATCATFHFNCTCYEKEFKARLTMVHRWLNYHWWAIE